MWKIGLTYQLNLQKVELTVKKNDINLVGNKGLKKNFHAELISNICGVSASSIIFLNVGEFGEFLLWIKIWHLIKAWSHKLSQQGLRFVSQ